MITPLATLSCANLSMGDLTCLFHISPDMTTSLLPAIYLTEKRLVAILWHILNGQL